MLDLSNIKEAIGNDTDALNELLSVFVSDTEETSAFLFESIKKENWEKIRFNAHKLKGSMRMFGAKDLCDVFEKIELLAKTEKDKTQLLLLSKNLNESISSIINFVKNNFPV